MALVQCSGHAFPCMEDVLVNLCDRLCGETQSLPSLPNLRKAVSHQAAVPVFCNIICCIERWKLIALLIDSDFLQKGIDPIMSVIRHHLHIAQIMRSRLPCMYVHCRC